MAKLSLRDRFFSPPVAHAVTSPSAILAFGAGAAVGVVAAPLTLAIAPFALVGGALAYAGRVALAIPRTHRRAAIDPFAVKEPWRHAVIDATVARKRFDAAVQTFRSGPLREALTSMGDQLDAAVDECWRIAQQGQLMDDARQRINDREARSELKRVSGSVADGAQPSSTQAQTIASLQSQLATADRMDRLITSTREQLDLLNARLDESVTQAIELSVSNRAGGLDPLSGQLGAIVDDLSSLRAAVEDVDAGDPSEPAAFDDLTAPSAAPGGADPTGPVASEPEQQAPRATPPPPPPPPPAEGHTR